MFWFIFVLPFSTQPKFYRSSTLSYPSIRCVSNCIGSLDIFKSSDFHSVRNPNVTDRLLCFDFSWISSPLLLRFISVDDVSLTSKIPRVGVTGHLFCTMCILLELWSKIEFSFHVHHQLTPQSHRFTFLEQTLNSLKLMVGKYSDLSFKENFPNRCYILFCFSVIFCLSSFQKYTLYLSLSLSR